MKTNYYFTAYERMLLARYCEDIKAKCWRAYKTLSSAEKTSIHSYRAQFNKPEKYTHSKYRNVFLPENELIKLCNIDKIRSFFTEDIVDRAARKYYHRTIKISYDSLKKFMTSIADIPELGDKDVKWLQLASLVADRFALIFDNTEIIFDTKEEK